MAKKAKNQIIKRLLIHTFLASSFATSVYIVTNENVIICVICSLAFVIWSFINAYRVAYQLAFTEAAKNMKPIEQVDNEELFPEEIDPYLAKPQGLQIMENLIYEYFIGFAGMMCTYLVFGTLGVITKIL